ncbi:30S ribosomal protein S16 [Halobacteriovorax sp. HLS]|uniref:30S ribosomal protein S16 n=1 Tax=Halobacteriovorax sp. HLS TaxID=2234000 RepID=UPI000FDCB433|nr:30S ribosomal protein S16 [Halobacteriovorax sp. HLS]
MLTIRMQRGGRVHMPIYTIVATDSRNPRDGRFNERLGQYNPHIEGQQLIDIKADRINALVKNGATMSDTVKSLFKKNKVLVG